ncbi:MAG: WD40 repeat domain-containing protein [Verrucomicrobia bacterium]|nr:WD40 repeat domain-containing protein [Verrucomicrobiota bacterium]
MKAEPVKEHKLPTAVLALDAASDGRQLFAACFDGGVYQVDVDTGNFERLLKHDSYASGVWHLPTSQLLISAGYDGVLHWFDLASRKPVRQVRAHRFWSWQMAVSPDERLVASVTGQYLAGGYKYEPGPEQEPSVRVFDVQTGELRRSVSLGPSVLSLAFSPDSRCVAAANMMGDVRVWDLTRGELAAAWATPDFTSWGIIKSHHYCGGIFAMAFTPDGHELFVCGMGPMRDPMAGNGKQTWQRFAWRENPPRKTGEIEDGDRGNGLMETIEFHPSQKCFFMAGRLAQGKWNAALFDSSSGKLLHGLDTKMRVTSAAFSADGARLFLAGAVGQQKKKDGKLPEFGRIKAFHCAA